MYGLLRLDVGIVTDYKVHTVLYKIENELFNGLLVGYNHYWKGKVYV